MALIDDPNKKLQEEEENKAGQNTNTEVVNEEPAVTKVEESAVEKVGEPATTTVKESPKPNVVFPNVSLAKERAEEISKAKQERKEKREAERAEWEKERAEAKALREQANAVTLEDRSANALRDYGRYFRNNSYGNTFDQEQLQTSMQPEDIRAFQKKHGIPVTGWVGRKTYLKLKEEWEKANNTEEAKEKEADEAEKALASDPTLSPAEQEKLRNEFAKNAEVRKWVKKYKTEHPADFPDEAVIELQGILKKYGYDTKLDDIFGSQTMWHFFQALETKDPELAATLKQAGIVLGEDGTVSVQRPYDHIMDYLNDKQDRERAMYERDYALRKSERDRKMQALNDVFSMIKDTVVASGGVKPESRDTSDKYKAIQKYAQEANEKYRQYEEDRRKMIINLAKANEDERQEREDTIREEEVEERRRKEDKLFREKELASQENIAKMYSEATKYKADKSKEVADTYANAKELGKLSEKSNTAKQKANQNGELTYDVYIEGERYDIPLSILTNVASKYNVKLEKVGTNPKTIGQKTWNEILTKVRKNENYDEFIQDLLKEYDLYNGTSKNIEEESSEKNTKTAPWVM